MNLLAGARRFSLALALLLAAMLVLTRPMLHGDVAEYTLTTIAMAAHGTPEIRPGDIARAKQLMPHLSVPFDLLDQGMRDKQPLYAAFTRGREGKVYGIHFFGYPGLVAGPFKLLEMAGLPAFKAFQLVNLAAIFVLGLSLFRLFGCGPSAMLGVLLFLASGGVLYGSWTSPECLSAAALLAGLALYTSGAPLPAALLAGLAGQQNPTILFFFGFAPLLQLYLGWQPGAGLRANLARVLDARTLLALAAGLAVYGLPILFNLYQYGVPNIIAAHFSDASLIGLPRLISFYFDLNQGMIIGIPGVLAALALWGWKLPGTTAQREAVILALCALFALALALPSLAVPNWNSDAAGPMRYAFWSAMPLLFALLLRLRHAPRWPRSVLAGVALVQAACMLSAASYSYVEMSPLARAVLRLAPQLYHPEPEIFAERLAHNDDYIEPGKIYSHRVDGAPVTTLLNTGHAGSVPLLCGKGATLSADNRISATTGDWRYIDGAVRCMRGSRQVTFGVDQFETPHALQLGSGWSAPERGGSRDGVWSEGQRSRLTIAAMTGPPSTTLEVLGLYFGANQRTRVSVNGVDLGWHQLDRPSRIPLPPGAGQAGALQVELEHEAPSAPGGGDQRALALFMYELTLR